MERITLKYDLKIDLTVYTLQSKKNLFCTLYEKINEMNKDLMYYPAIQRIEIYDLELHTDENKEHYNE